MRFLLNRRCVLFALVLVAGTLFVTTTPARAESGDVVKAPVTDYAEAVPAPLERYVGKELEEHSQKTGIHMAIVVLQTTEGEPLAEVSQRIVDNWGGGEAGVRRAILLTIVTESERAHLDVGADLENALPVGWIERLMARTRPTLQAGDYGRAVRSVADAVVERTESLEPGETPGRFASNPLWDPIVGGWGILLLGWLISMLLIAFKEREVRPFSSEQGIWWRLGAHVVVLALVAAVTYSIAWQGYVLVYAVGVLCGAVLAYGQTWRRFSPLVAVIAVLALSVFEPELAVFYNRNTDWALASLAVWFFSITMIPYSQTRFYGKAVGPGTWLQEGDADGDAGSANSSDSPDPEPDTDAAAPGEREDWW